MASESLLAKQIIIPAKASGRWFGIDFHANLYQGCPHGCLFCEFAAGGNDFSRLSFRPNTLELLARELSGKPLHTMISLGSEADPYNAMELETRLTRQTLELIDRHQMGLALTTKSEMVLRDVDLLRKISRHSPVVVLVPISTFQEAVSKKVEPNAPKPTDRFKMIAKLTTEGILCGIKMIPIIPFINDSEENVRDIIRAGKSAGSRFIYPSFGITLRNGQRERFHAMIEREFPGLKNIFMDTYGSKIVCVSPHAPQLKKAFVIECKKQKILYGMKEIVQLIRPEKTIQLKLF